MLYEAVGASLTAACSASAGTTWTALGSRWPGRRDKVTAPAAWEGAGLTHSIPWGGTSGTAKGTATDQPDHFHSLPVAEDSCSLCTALSTDGTNPSPSSPAPQS